MNILAFLNSYTHGKSGGDMCFINAFSRFKKINLTIVTSENGKKLCLENNLKAKFIITTHEKKFNNTYLIYTQRIINGILFKYISGYDIVYATSDSLPDVLLSVVYKIKNPNSKLVCKIFHIIPNRRLISSLLQFLSHFLIKNFANKIIVDNKILQKTLLKKGFSQDKVELIYPGIDTAKLKKVIPEKKYDAIYMGRIHKSKSIEDLIEIFRNVKKTYKNVKLALIGTGEEKYISIIKEKILKFNLENNIKLLGYLPDKKAYSLIKGSSVFTFPSHEEGFGMAIAEALYLGVTVVTYNLPIIKELYQNKVIAAECFDKKEFEKKVLQALKKSFSSRLINKTTIEFKNTYSIHEAFTKEYILLKSLVS
jgi:glycosyltransferase involved in cell wall biosynthesis